MSDRDDDNGVDNDLDDSLKRNLFTELYGAANKEFLLDEASDQLYVTCQTHGIRFHCYSVSPTHFNFVGEQDYCQIFCSILRFKTTSKRHTVRFENAARMPIAAVLIEQID